MITETQKAQLVHHLQSNVEWRYPVEAGAQQYDFDPGTGLMVYRRGEPISKTYPAIEMSFLPRSAIIGDGLSHVIKDYSGALVYGYGELEPVIITVYTHQICSGTTYNYHGKIIADEYARRIERYIRRYWPRLLEPMEAYIKESIPITVQDISEFLFGTERQGFELTLYLVTTNKWDYADEDEYVGIEGAAEPVTSGWEDAVISGAQQIDYEAGRPYMKYISVSGYMQDK